MSQKPLFLESFGQAVMELARSYPGQPKPSGGEYARGPKGFAHRLAPNKSLDSAHKWLLDCCNPDREDRKFSDEDREEILRIGREVGCHVVKHYLDDVTGYERSEPINPVDEKAKLQREFVASVQHLSRLAEKIERIDAPAGFKVVSR